MEAAELPAARGQWGSGSKFPSRRMQGGLAALGNFSTKITYFQVLGLIKFLLLKHALTIVEKG